MDIRQISPERASAMLSVVKELQLLSSSDLEEAAKACRWHRYELNENILRYNDICHSVFFVVQGEIRITYYSMSGHEVILCDLLAGEMFGELAAIDGLSRSATVVAKTSALLAVMPVPFFLDLIYSNKKINEAILKRLAGEIRRLTERIYDFSTLVVSNRIRAELLRLASNHMTSSNEAIISPAPTHTDIANLVSTHREAVTRELSNLTRKKVVMRNGNTLHILDVSKLKEMVRIVRGSL